MLGSVLKSCLVQVAIKLMLLSKTFRNENGSLSLIRFTNIALKCFSNIRFYGSS